MQIPLLVLGTAVDKDFHMILKLSALPTKTNTYANSLDLEEIALNKPFHQNLHGLPFYF